MRLIDADELLKGILELKQSPWFNSKYGYADRKEAVEIIEDLCIKEEPTIDAVEVVRCKDCKFYEPLTPSIGRCHEDLVTLAKNPNDYCSYGERKDEE